MNDQETSIAAIASQVAARVKPSIYPEPFASRMAGREKRCLGDFFGLNNFGVNLTRLLPGACSALRHAHSKQDEFIYILCGHPVLITEIGDTEISPGMCAGFNAGTGDAHQLLNRSDEEVQYLEMGDRSAGDVVMYPNDDLQAAFVEKTWQFMHKDGSPY
jgi:uncharacterized cupin superfamily protein